VLCGEGGLKLEFEEPFETLRSSNRASAGKEKDLAGSGRDSKIWLPKNQSLSLLREF